LKEFAKYSTIFIDNTLGFIHNYVQKKNDGNLTIRAKYIFKLHKKII